MGVRAHLKVLQTKHLDLDDQIKRELKHPQPDSLRLSTLKRRKLQLKDQIISLQAQ